MTKPVSIKLSINHVEGRASGLVARFGYFDSQISLEQSRLIAKLIWAFKNEKLYSLVATYFFSEAKWKHAYQLGWQVDLRKTFTRKAWFPRTIEHDWVVGNCPSEECLQEVLHTGWNLSGNESLIMILTNDTNQVLPKIEETYQDDFGTLESNELVWMDLCPFVFSRDHDGLALRLYTLSLNENQLQLKLKNILNSLGINFVLSAKPL